MKFSPPSTRTAKCYHHIMLACLTAFVTLAACTSKESEKIVAPWGEVGTGDTTSADGFSVNDIIANGEIIALTLSGANTYYTYRGHGMGTQYLLCEKFAQHIGVALRMEVCKDTTEMIERLNNGDADIIALMLPDSTIKDKGLKGCGATTEGKSAQWAVNAESNDLAAALNKWYKPEMMTQVINEQKNILATGGIKRHVYAPFMDRQRGVISRYDPLFKKHAPTARWDWRLLAAQCYQESCFDPQAKSWAGACGLMQIMPATAAHLGIAMENIYNPEHNIAGATRYIRELDGKFRNVTSPKDRMCFVLASYNGGFFHIHDAMALARKYGRNPHRWSDVAYFVLALQNPNFYNDPVVRNGYMRGSETVEYVDRIRQRYAQYRGVPYSGATINSSEMPDIKDQSPHPNSHFTPQRAKKKYRFKI